MVSIYALLAIGTAIHQKMKIKVPVKLPIRVKVLLPLCFHLALFGTPEYVLGRDRTVLGTYERKVFKRMSYAIVGNKTFFKHQISHTIVELWYSVKNDLNVKQ